MDGRRYFYFGLLLFWALIPQALAQNDVASLEQPVENDQETMAESAGLFEDILANWWREYETAKQHGDRETQEKAYQNFRDLKLENHAEIFELGAYLFLEEGFRDLGLQKYDSARIEFHQALELNPYLWPARMGLAKIKKERDGDYGRYIHLNYEGLIRAFHPRNTYFIFDALIWFFSNVLRILFATFIFLVLIFSVKYARSFYATTVAAFEHQGLKSLYAQLMTMVVMVLPLLLGLNLALAAGVYLAFFFPFLEGREKQVGIVALLSWLLFPMVLLMVTNINFGRANPVLQAHLSQYYQGDNATQIKRLSSLSSAGELKNRTKMLLGKYFKHNDQLLEAMAVFQEIPKSSKYYELAQVNKANIHVLAKEYQQAIIIYKSISGNKAPLGLALYNLSVVKALLGNHEESGNYRSQALRVAPHLENQAGLFENVDERFLIDGEPNPVSRVGDVILGRGNPIYKGWYSRPDLLFMGLAGLVLLLLALFFVRARNMRAQAKPCNKCGMMFFISDSPNSDWCTQCVSLYIRKEDLPSEAKINKSEQVQRHSRMKRWVVNGLQLVLPGAKQLLRGHSWSGFFTLAIWMMLLVMGIYPIDHIPHGFMNYFDWPSFWAYLCFGVTLVFWVIFGFRGVWQED